MKKTVADGPNLTKGTQTAKSRTAPTSAVMVVATPDNPIVTKEFTIAMTAE